MSVFLDIYYNDNTYLECFCIFSFLADLLLPKFSPELKFEPEPLRTGPKFSSKFSTFAELDLKFSSGFSRIK